MADSSPNDRSSRRHAVKGLELHYSPTGFLAFLSKRSPDEKLPVVNFSLGGLQFLAGKEFKEGEHLRLNLATSEGGQPLVLEAEVRWCRRIPRRAAHRVGVSFISLDEESRRRLQGLEEQIGSLSMKMACPKCGAALTMKKKYEGSKARCPRCKAAIDILDREELPEVPEEQVQHEAQQAAGAAAAEDEGEAEGKAGYKYLSPDLVRFLKRAIGSQLHLDLVQHFAKSERNRVAGVKDLSKMLAVGQKEVRLALRDLVTRGILKEIGVKTFTYDPTPGPKRDIAELLTSLGSPSKRSEVLAVLLKSWERKR